MKHFVKPLRKEGHSDVWRQKSEDLGENMLPLSRKDILFYSVQEGRLSVRGGGEGEGRGRLPFEA